MVPLITQGSPRETDSLKKIIAPLVLCSDYFDLYRNEGDNIPFDIKINSISKKKCITQMMAVFTNYHF